MDSIRVLFSEDGGSTWDYVPQYFSGITDLYEESNGSVTVSTAARIYRSEDMVTWSSVPTGLTGDTASSALTTQAGHAVAVGNAAKTSRAPLAYNYDTATQFRVPKLKAEAGALNFYKAKVAA